MKLDWLSFMMR